MSRQARREQEELVSPLDTVEPLSSEVRDTQAAAASLLFYRRDKHRYLRSGQVKPAVEPAIPSAKITVSPRVLELPKIPRRRHFWQTGNFVRSRRLPIQYRTVESITASLEDDPLEVIGLLQLDLGLGV